MSEYGIFLNAESFHSLAQKMSLKSLPKEENPIAYVGKLASLLDQDQVTAAVRNSLAGDLESESLLGFEREVKGDLNYPVISQAKPPWTNLDSYIEEILRLNNPSLWMDLLSQAGRRDMTFLDSALRVFRKNTIADLANRFTAQNSKLYINGFLWPGLSALVGSQTDIVVRRSQIHPPFAATQVMGRQFDGPAIDFDQLLERLQGMYAVSEAKNPTTQAHDVLVDHGGFVNTLYQPELNCPAIGLANMISIGVADSLRRPADIARFRGRVTLVA